MKKRLMIKLFHARIPNLTARTNATLIFGKSEISQSSLMMFHN